MGRRYKWLPLLLCACSSLGFVLISVLSRKSQYSHTGKSNENGQSAGRFPIEPIANDQPNRGETDSQEWISIGQSDEIVAHDGKKLDVELFEGPAVLTPHMLRPPTQQEGRYGDLLSSYTVWSMDLRVGPVYAMQRLLSRYGMRVIERSLSPLCDVTGTCAPGPVVPPDDWVYLTDRARQAARRLLTADPEFQRADAVLCVHPLSLCQIYAPYNKTLLLVVDARYELGRSEPHRWRRWNDDLREMAASGRAVVAATSQYDVEYVRHFSGVGPMLAPYHCDYLQYYYRPAANAQFLLTADRGYGFMEYFQEEYNAAVGNMSSRTMSVPTLRVVGDGEAGEHQTDVTRYWGVVYIPHQVSFLAFTERYRMNVPLFVPAVELLVHWHQRYHVMPERCLRESMTRDRGGSRIEGSSMPDPDNDVKDWTIAFWVEFADFYEWPGIQRFRSVSGLAERLGQLRADDLAAISDQMRDYNNHVMPIIEGKWRDVLNKTFHIN